MPRYELGEKFWTIERDPKYKWITTTVGRTGTAGTTKKKKFKKPHECSRDYGKLIHDKLGKGYRLAVGLSHVETRTQRNPELEAAIAEAPGDRERWSVYADWLQEAGDPRGELIALHVAKKTAAAKAYVKKHSNVLWGDARYLAAKQPFKGRTWEGWDDEGAEYESLSLELAYGPFGLVTKAAFHGLDEYGHVAGAVTDLLTSPMGMFVESLSFTVGEDFEGSSGQPNYGMVAQALGGVAPKTLREIAMMSSGYQRSWTGTGDLTHMLANLPRLERLELSLGEIAIGKQIDLPVLTKLRIVTGGLAAANVRAIAAAKWPALEELVLYFGTDRYGGTATMKDVRALLATKFPKLKRLALCNADKLQSQIAIAALGSPLAKQLTSLDLSRGTMHDADVPAIAAGAVALPKLELDLTENYFSPATEKSLRKQLGKRVSMGDQRYGEMIDEQGQYGQEKWAIESKATFRYSSIGE